jgi:hypothetical protein
MTQNGAGHRRNASRRQVLVAGGAAIAVAGAGTALATNAAGAETPQTKGPKPAAGEACYRLSMEAIEGPYYIDAARIRRDVTEDRAFPSPSPSR